MLCIGPCQLLPVRFPGYLHYLPKLSVNKCTQWLSLRNNVKKGLSCKLVRARKK